MKWYYKIKYTYCGISNERNPDKFSSGTVIAKTKSEAMKKARSGEKSGPWKFDGFVAIKQVI